MIAACSLPGLTQSTAAAAGSSELHILFCSTHKFLVLLIACAVIFSSPVHAQNGLNKKSINQQESASAGSYNLSFGTSVQDILQNETDINAYDPLTIASLKRLREDAQPSWSPDDMDAGRTQRVVEKAITIQSGRALGALINQSELKHTYSAAKRGWESFRRLFNYSVQSDGEKLTVSREKKGKKLLELDMDFNLKQGIDPQIRLGDYVRFRYDYTTSRTMLEYGWKF